ncbi:MAG: hypothetical protein ACKV2U_08375 [Bryobacteraceae bacterium]
MSLLAAPRGLGADRDFISPSNPRPPLISGNNFATNPRKPGSFGSLLLLGLTSASFAAAPEGFTEYRAGQLPPAESERTFIARIEGNGMALTRRGWPAVSGAKQEFTGVPANRHLRAEERSPSLQTISAARPPLEVLSLRFGHDEFADASLASECLFTTKSRVASVIGFPVAHKSCEPS